MTTATSREAVRLPGLQSSMTREPSPPAHLPSAAVISGWPLFTAVRLLRILVSGCLAGLAVGADGSSYGSHPYIAELMGLSNVKATAFCPEHFPSAPPGRFVTFMGEADTMCWPAARAS